MGQIEPRTFNPSPSPYPEPDPNLQLTAQGMVESFVARFPAEDAELLALHREQAPHVSD